MMGPKQEAHSALFYKFSLKAHVPQGHLLRSIDRFLDLNSIRGHLAGFYIHTGRPSIDPELRPGCYWWGIALLFSLNVVFVKRYI